MLEVLRTFWSELVYIFLEMSPYIVLGLLIAGVLKVFVPDGWVQKVVGKRHAGVPPLTSLIGVPLPLCSCSVLPFALGLRKQGASKGAVAAFLTSTPQTGVDSILAAYGFFGLPFALYKMSVSFISGTLSGWFVDLFSRNEPDRADDFTVPVTCDCTDDSCSPAAEEADTRGCGSGGCSVDAGGPSDTAVTNEHTGSRLGFLFRFAFGELFEDVAVVFLLGIIASALIGTLFPPDLLQGFRYPWLYYPAVLLISVPLYVCATASLPIAFALMQAGMPPGAAMVLLIAGPATNIATLGVVAKTLGKRTAAVYVIVIVLSALIGGFLFDRLLGAAFVPGSGADAEDAGGFELPYPLQVVFALLLAGLIIYHVGKKIGNRFRRR
jgi:uncharacterized protein